MSDWPAFYYPPPPIITPVDLESMGFGTSGYYNAQMFDNMASAAVLVNNKAYFYPFRLNVHVTAYQLLLWVGATSSGNIDVGIYDSQKNLIVSAGSTAMSATVNTWQQINIADTALPPGDYLLAGVSSTTGATIFRLTANDELGLPARPVYEQTTALPLPDPCNPVFCTDASPPVWALGIQTVPTF